FPRAPHRDHELVSRGNPGHRPGSAQSGEELGEKRILDGVPGGRLVRREATRQLHASAEGARRRFTSVLLHDVVDADVSPGGAAGGGAQGAGRAQSAVILRAHQAGRPADRRGCERTAQRDVPGVTIKLGVVALAGTDNGGTYQYTLSTLQALRH